MSRRIGLELRETQQMIKHRIEKDRREDSLNLTHGQIRILLFINDKEEPVYQKDIEAYLRIRRSTATEMLNVLERHGYIKRKRAKHDGRLKEIHITDITLKVIDDMDAYIINLEEVLRKDIDEKDLSIFFNVLDQLKENISKG